MDECHESKYGICNACATTEQIASGDPGYFVTTPHLILCGYPRIKPRDYTRLTQKSCGNPCNLVVPTPKCLPKNKVAKLADGTPHP